MTPNEFLSMKATERGLTPQALLDELVQQTKALAHTMENPIKCLPNGEEVGTAVIIHRPGGDVLTSIRTGTSSFSRRFQFPGGSVDEGEDSWVAAEREVFEEVGLRVRLLAKDRTPFMRTPGVKLRDGREVRFVTDWFHVAVPADTVIPPNPEPHKHTDWTWSPLRSCWAWPPFLTMPGSPEAVRYLLEHISTTP